MRIIILLLLAIFAVKPVDALVIRERIILKSSYVKEVITPTPVVKKPSKVNLVATPRPQITPYRKFLTETGSNTRDKVMTLLSKYYTDEDLIAAENILKKESGFRADAINEIGCGGIAQACPASKMNCPVTVDGWECQAQWFVGYLNSRYHGSPTEAYKFHEINNYY